MNNWLLPWWGQLRAPLSGDSNQYIAPTTTWLSPQFELNFAGNRKIEAEVVADVASYGKQLGILSDAILELAKGKSGKAIDRLQTLVNEVEDVKNQHKDILEQRVKADLDKLKEQDPKAFRRLLSEFR